MASSNLKKVQCPIVIQSFQTLAWWRSTSTTHTRKFVINMPKWIKPTPQTISNFCLECLPTLLRTGKVSMDKIEPRCVLHLDTTQVNRVMTKLENGTILCYPPIVVLTLLRTGKVSMDKSKPLRVLHFDMAQVNRVMTKLENGTVLCYAPIVVIVTVIKIMVMVELTSWRSIFEFIRTIVWKL